MLYYVIRKKLVHAFSCKVVYRVIDVLGKFGDEHSKELELLVLSKLNNHND